MKIQNHKSTVSNNGRVALKGLLPKKLDAILKIHKLYSLLFPFLLLSGYLYVSFVPGLCQTSWWLVFKPSVFFFHARYILVSCC
ncbi:hypothetical protein CISIN_1g034802mg [Citrus sinensis]|uniref:Fatty acid desaturase N-terminal domain-containing protein n=1 Tax=Citrus sinensis TaxID=2711 RepID=A0A067ENJ2_CITSI|nr:hypothetical protein CISIN_1g034802mg [Citrus sinensis]